MGNPNPKLENLKPFKAGVDPRRGTKPKGSKHISTYIQELMEDDSFTANILDPKIGLKEYKGIPVKAIINVAITKAVNGDSNARDWLAKYGWTQKQEVEHAGAIEVITRKHDDS